MSILAHFLPADCDGLELCHAQISYSSSIDLKRRLAHLCCDMWLWEHTMEPLGHAITDCTVLWSLVGM